jgi:hypothetical protein
MTFLMTNKVMILGILLGLSETLAVIPAIKANSIFEAIVSFIKLLAGK